MRTALAFAACLLLLAPAAQAGDAQSPLTIESVSIPDPSPVPFDGEATVTITVGVGCVNALRAAAQAGSQTAVATPRVDNAPRWLTFTPTAIGFDVSGCPTAGGYLTKAGTAVLKVAPDAPGVIVQSINVSATMPAAQGELVATAVSTQFNVSYQANHTITPRITFPHTMTGGYLNFTVDVTYAANAPGMVMVENLKASSGTVSGLASAYYAPPETKTFQVSFKAPPTPWNQTTVSFHAYSHLLLNGTPIAGAPQLAQDYTWVINNGNPDGSPDGKPSPMGGWPLFATLGLAVLVASRRVRKNQ